MSKDRTESIKV